MQEILKSNKGFKHPERWVDYGVLHNFRNVQAEKLEFCPDCGGCHSDFIGQYVYYSTLVELRSCHDCALQYSDTRFDPKVVHGHFEQAYKDEDYFATQRRGIFEQIASLVDEAADHGASVLDIGGAKGHLLAMVKQRRPDLKLLLNDLSRMACEFAESQYGLMSLCGAVDSLEGLSQRFDVVILSDVMYYEPELGRLWSLLSRIVSEAGVVIIRVPNRAALIRLGSIARKVFQKRKSLEMQDSVWFLNSEHLYVFSRKYLVRRLHEIGFSTVSAVPSALLEKVGHLRYLLYHCLAKALFFGSLGRAIVTPSMIVVAKRQS